MVGSFEGSTGRGGAPTPSPPFSPQKPSPGPDKGVWQTVCQRPPPPGDFSSGRRTAPSTTQGQLFSISHLFSLHFGQIFLHYHQFPSSEDSDLFPPHPPIWASLNLTARSPVLLPAFPLVLHGQASLRSFRSSSAPGCRHLEAWGQDPRVPVPAAPSGTRGPSSCGKRCGVATQVQVPGSGLSLKPRAACPLPHTRTRIPGWRKPREQFHQSVRRWGSCLPLRPVNKRALQPDSPHTDVPGSTTEAERRKAASQPSAPLHSRLDKS